jgi:hypothetical protein
MPPVFAATVALTPFLLAPVVLAALATAALKRRRVLMLVLPFHILHGLFYYSRGKAPEGSILMPKPYVCYVETR